MSNKNRSSQSPADASAQAAADQGAEQEAQANAVAAGDYSSADAFAGAASSQGDATNATEISAEMAAQGVEVDAAGNARPLTDAEREELHANQPREFEPAASADASASEASQAASGEPIASSEPIADAGASDLDAIQSGVDAADGGAAAAAAPADGAQAQNPTAKEAVEQAMDEASADEPLIAIEPVRDYFINGVPHVAQEVPASVAATYVKTGAFTYANPEDAPSGD